MISETQERHSSLLILLSVDQQGGEKGDYSSLTIERVSEQETTQVQLARSGNQAVIEEVITRVEESEREVIEEKGQREFIKCNIVLSDSIFLNGNTQTLH